MIPPLRGICRLALTAASGAARFRPCEGGRSLRPAAFFFMLSDRPRRVPFGPDLEALGLEAWPTLRHRRHSSQATRFKYASEWPPAGAGRPGRAGVTVAGLRPRRGRVLETLARRGRSAGGRRYMLEVSRSGASSGRCAGTCHWVRFVGREVQATVAGLGRVRGARIVARARTRAERSLLRAPGGERRGRCRWPEIRGRAAWRWIGDEGTHGRTNTK